VLDAAYLLGVEITRLNSPESARCSGGGGAGGLADAALAEKDLHGCATAAGSR